MKALLAEFKSWLYGAPAKQGKIYLSDDQRGNTLYTSFPYQEATRHRLEQNKLQKTAHHWGMRVPSFIP